MTRTPPKHCRTLPGRLADRGGFTLVELLVAVGLTMLIMLMFTQIFQITTAGMQTQKGIAENDQRARMATIIFKEDLKNRTMKTVWPFAPAEPDPLSGAMCFQLRQGYFYISENDPDDDTDDVLQFTVMVTADDRMFGKAQNLGSLLNNPNQPDFDDLSGPDNTGQSTAAEICYFVRNGILYRRVMLLRDPVDPTWPEEPTSGNPPNQPSATTELVKLDYPRSFWRDFDYSAHFDSASGPQFHGALTWLRNDNGFSSLGYPHRRFGHRADNGQPREYVRLDPTDPASLVFIGRYTHEETSARAFRYPSSQTEVDPQTGTTTQYPHPLTSPDEIRMGGPASPRPGVVQWEDGNGNWSSYDGLRRGEDIMLTNVHAFDIKVLDEGLTPPQFVNIGHTQAGGHYSATADQNDGYGPRPTGNNIFDTWNIALTSMPGSGLPPYRPEDTMTGQRWPLRTIRITLRYFDVSSEQTRELSLAFSLVPKEEC